MWGVDDEIRAAVKEINKIIQEADNTANPSLNRAIADQVIPTLHEISEMVYKEENILFPMCLETLTEDEWKEIGEQLKDPEMARYQMQSQGDEVGGTADGLINLMSDYFGRADRFSHTFNRRYICR